MSGSSKNELSIEPLRFPREISQYEYNELLEQVKALNMDEAKEELLDCARYGDVDAVHAILDVFASIVNCVDDVGSTPLHKASANGHVTTVQLLLVRGADCLCNKAGNTPLHWASAAGHPQIVKLLLSHEPFASELDVLKKNSFGRSSLTEGFSSKNTDLVKLLLEHDSATVEKLIGGGQRVDEEQSIDRNKGKTSVVHAFDFRINSQESAPSMETKEPDELAETEKNLYIRELPIAHADDPFGLDAAEDTTGFGIWCASLVMARWMASASISERFQGKTVLELGAGCGVPGFAAAIYSNAKKVYITDLNPTTIDNLRHNIDLNKQARCVEAFAINWNDEGTWPEEKVDYVIGSDLIYQASIVPLLKKVVRGLINPHDGRFLYVAPNAGRDGLDEFIDSMKSDGCNLVSETVAPHSYHANPLANRDDDECFVHFHELQSTAYSLYEFKCT